MSMFDPTSFLETSYTESNDTVVVPIPEGEYTAVADKVEAKEWASKSDPTNSGLKLVINWSIDDAEVKAIIGRDKALCRQDIMLDLLDGSNRLDMGKGKNVELGKVRAATDLNDPGKPFNPMQIQGQVAKVRVKHRVDGDKVYAEVKAVAHA